MATWSTKKDDLNRLKSCKKRFSKDHNSTEIYKQCVDSILNIATENKSLVDIIKEVAPNKNL